MTPDTSTPTPSGSPAPPAQALSLDTAPTPAPEGPGRHVSTGSADELAVEQREAQSRARRRLAVVRGWQVAIFVLVVGGWEVLSRAEILDPFNFSRPSAVVQQLVTWATDGTSAGPLWTQAAITIEEAVLGFAIGVVAGVICGVGLGRVRLLAEVFGPYIKVMNSIPRIVLGSILIIWFGLGMASKVALAVVLVFFAVFFNAFQGTREVDRNLVANARILGASPRQVTRHVILPSAFTWIIASLHTSFGFALIGAIVGEFLGAQQGLGLLIATAQGTFNPAGIFAAMVLIAIVALVAEGLITLLERRLLAWRPPQLSGSDA
ncbi:MAG: ABC transporter permease [Actinomycetes bacterium]